MAKFKSYLYESASELTALLGNSSLLEHCNFIVMEAETKSEAIDLTLELMEIEESYDGHKIYATIELHS